MSRIADPIEWSTDRAVTQILADNTATAAAAGIFGVPTLSLKNQNFWGRGTIEWANAFVANPSIFQTGEIKRAGEIGVGASRKEAV